MKVPDCGDSGEPKTGTGAPEFEDDEYEECEYNPDCDRPCHLKFLEGGCDDPEEML